MIHHIINGIILFPRLYDNFIPKIFLSSHQRDYYSFSFRSFETLQLFFSYFFFSLNLFTAMGSSGIRDSHLP